MRKAWRTSLGLLILVSFFFLGCGGGNGDQKANLQTPDKGEHGLAPDPKPAKKTRKRTFFRPNFSVVLSPVGNERLGSAMDLVLDEAGDFRNVLGLLLKDEVLARIMHWGNKNKPFFITIIVRSDKHTRVETLALAVEKLLSFAEGDRPITVYVGVDSLAIKKEKEKRGTKKARRVTHQMRK
jgi:hypothetical protein